MIRSLLRSSAAIALCAGLLGAVSGCGEAKKDPPQSPDKMAAAKVKAMNLLADQMAKDPDGADARGALEEFRITPMDLAKYPNEANDIIEVYRQRIQGKYKGFVAQEIQNEMSAFQKSKKSQ